jgi:hypothetical protein
MEERGFIRFEYPFVPANPTWGRDRAEDALGNLKFDVDVITRKLPFYENPQLSERRRANYAQKNIFLRNEPVRLYTGSGPRTFRLLLTYTLPHIAQFVKNYISNPKILTPEEKVDFEHLKQSIKTLLIKQSNTGNKFGPAGSTQIITEGGYTVGLNDTIINPTAGPGDGPHMPAVQPVALEGIDNKLFFNAQVLWANYHVDLTTIIQYMLNIARSSVIGTVDSSVKYGPPIGYLNYGTVYNEVPVIVKEYKITMDSKEGIDHSSLLSRVLKIDLSLEEFSQQSGILHGKGNTNPIHGWDSIFNTGKI